MTNRTTCPLNFTFIEVPPPEPGTPILFFTPYDGDGGCSEPYLLGTKKEPRCQFPGCTIIMERHVHWPRLPGGASKK